MEEETKIEDVGQKTEIVESESVGDEREIGQYRRAETYEERFNRLNFVHKRIFKGWYPRAFALRVRGFTYKRIQEQLAKEGIKISYMWLRCLFSRKGYLREMWEEYKRTMKEDAIEEAVTMMYGNLADSARALAMEAKKGGMSGNSARRILLEYTLGPPAQRHILSGEVGIVTLEQFTKKLHEGIVVGSDSAGSDSEGKEQAEGFAGGVAGESGQLLPVGLEGSDDFVGQAGGNSEGYPAP